jgi:hypothetical protein
MFPRLMTASAACRLCGCHPSRLTPLIQAGIVRCSRLVRVEYVERHPNLRGTRHEGGNHG